MTVTQELAALRDREYTQVVKGRLGNDDTWPTLVEPELLEKTRLTLLHMLVSIDNQLERVGQDDLKWRASVSSLRRMVKGRYDALPPLEAVEEIMSGSREAKAWRSFSALLALALEDGDSEALDRIKTPYGGLTAREWLQRRDAK